MSQKHRTVLIVDDSWEDGEIYGQYLQQDREYDYKIVQTKLGREGLTLWRQHQPDITLLDYRLPDLDGVEFLTQLQTWTRQLFLPVIVVTGQGNEAIAVQAIKAGAQDYLVKGQMTSESLRLAVNKAIENMQLRTQLQHEQALRKQTEERLRVALDAAGMGTWDWNIQTNHIQWSANLEAMFGLAPGEFDGSYDMFVSSLHPEDRDRVLEAINSAVTTGSDCKIEFRVVHPNGTIRWALSQGRVFYDQAGQPVRMAGVDLDITERKRSETELRENKAWLKLGQKATKSGLWDWDVITNKARIAEEYCTIFGLDPATKEISFEDWLSLVHPDDRTLVTDYNTRITQQQQEDYEIEYRILHPNGRRWLLARGQVFYDKMGKAVRVFGNVQDITERKQTEQALQESNERFRQLTENSHDVFWMRDMREQQVLYVSPAFQQIWGLDPQLLYGDSAVWEEEIIHPDDRYRTAAAFQEKACAGRFDEEYRLIKPDGTIQWIRDRAFPIYDESGEVYRLAGIAEDITERKHIENAVRQSEARYGYLAEAIPHLVWTCDAKGSCDYVNQRLCEYTGLTVEQSLGVGWLSAVHPDDVRLVQDMWRKAVENGTFYRDEYRFRRHADSSYRWHLALGLPVKDEQGQVVKWFGTCTDIHDQKELEIERDRIYQLEQVARNEAERANRIKDEFLAILSHELRSPLNPILGWTQLLQTRKLDSTKTAEALAIIERNVKLQTQLIDDLLDIARILRGKLSLNAKPVNLAFVIEAALDTVRAAAVAKSILIHPVLPNIGQVSGDSVRLQQIIWNLLSNAIKFTPHGGRVEIRLERVGDQAQITVTDTGKGISPEFLPHIFESFCQEDVSVTRKFGGLGLGLAIVRHLTEAHGGTVAADSPGVGLGATFTLRLPLVNFEPEINQTDDLLEHELDLTGIRVLTIDDEPDTRQLMTVLLAQYGAEVMTVASSREFLTALESFQPDVLVSDIGMPDVDGYTLLRQVRSLPPERGGQIGAIALTAYAGELDRQKALAAGFQRHLAKPIQPHQLIQAVAVVYRLIAHDSH